MISDQILQSKFNHVEKIWQSQSICLNELYHKKMKQAQLGVPHSEMQDELD